MLAVSTYILLYLLLKCIPVDWAKMFISSCMLSIISLIIVNHLYHKLAYIFASVKSTLLFIPGENVIMHIPDIEEVPLLKIGFTEE